MGIIKWYLEVGPEQRVVRLEEPREDMRFVVDREKLDRSYQLIREAVGGFEPGDFLTVSIRYDGDTYFARGDFLVLERLYEEGRVWKVTDTGKVYSEKELLRIFPNLLVNEVMKTPHVIFRGN